jgi:predicted metal-dependent peptidase
MTKSILDDASYWRKRAQETIAKAAIAWKPKVREGLLRVANEYEKIALRAERRGDPPSQCLEENLYSHESTRGS